MTTTETMIDVADFPGPHGVPMLGNLFDLDLQNPDREPDQDGSAYGPILFPGLVADGCLDVSRGDDGSHCRDLALECPAIAF
jgi:hypothetical protein